MKTIVDYLKENNYEGQIGEYAIEIFLHKDKINIVCDHDEYIVKSASEIQDILYDNYNTEIRFCSECGKPFDAGFMAGDGEWYCCEDCFEDVMNEDYGKGNWRATDEEGCYGGFYEYLDGNEWEDTGIFYTEWN